MLLQRLETAKITQRLEASKQGTRYTIIDPPRLPLQPTKPRIIFVFIGLFLGGGAGVGLVFAREFLDQSFLDIEDAKENLDMPVLGAISRITTQEEIRREKEKKIISVITVLVSSTVLIIAAVLYSLLKK
jgi:capsular polysaccharide biosynthesis protein